MPDTALAPRTTPGDRPRTARAARVLGRAGGALVDQVLSSGTQLLLIVLVARQADPTTFGAVSLALLTHGSSCRSCAGVGEVVLLRCRDDRSAARSEGCRGLFLALLAGMVAALGLGGASAVVGGQVGHFLLVMVLAAPPVYLQDVLRYVAYGAGRVQDAIVGDAVWLVVQVAVSAIVLASGDATPTRLVLAWVAEPGPAQWSGPPPPALAAPAAPSGSGGRRSGPGPAGSSPTSSCPTGCGRPRSCCSGSSCRWRSSAPARGHRGVSPLANLLAGVRRSASPTLRDCGRTRSGLRRRADRAGDGGAAAVYGVGLVLLPDRWGSELFGDTWTEAARSSASWPWPR